MEPGFDFLKLIPKDIYSQIFEKLALSTGKGALKCTTISKSWKKKLDPIFAELFRVKIYQQRLSSVSCFKRLGYLNAELVALFDPKRIRFETLQSLKVFYLNAKEPKVPNVPNLGYIFEQTTKLLELNTLLELTEPWPALSKLTQLTSLEVSIVNLHFLTALTKLKKLNLRFFWEQECQPFTKLNSLEQLTIRNFEPDVIPVIQGLSNLTRFKASMRFCGPGAFFDISSNISLPLKHFIIDDGIWTTPPKFTIARGFENLETLKIRHSRCSIKKLDLGHFPKLKRLCIHFDFLGNLDEALVNADELKHLCLLEISGRIQASKQKLLVSHFSNLTCTKKYDFRIEPDGEFSFNSNKS